MGIFNFFKKYDKRGFDKYGVHRNGTKYDDLGYDVNGFNKNGVNEEGYDKNSKKSHSTTTINSDEINKVTTANTKKIESNTNYIHIKPFNENTGDELKKLISEATNFATNPLLNNVAKYRGNLRTILNNKLERVDYSQSNYIDSLITNVIYYTKVIPNVKGAFLHYLEQNVVINEQELNQLIYNVQQHFKLPRYKYDNKDINNKQTYLNILPISKRIETLEFDYMYYFTYAEILFELLAYLTNASNKSILLTENPSSILSIIDNQARIFTSQLLGTLDMSLNK